MTLRNLSVEWTSVKSYKTEVNLLKRIEEDRDMYPGHDDRIMIIRTPEGRWTALVLLDRTGGGYIGRYEGFMKV